MGCGCTLTLYRIVYRGSSTLLVCGPFLFFFSFPFLDAGGEGVPDEMRFSEVLWASNVPGCPREEAQSTRSLRWLRFCYSIGGMGDQTT